MDYQNFLIDAVNQVLTWDIPDEALSDAVIVQAGIMAGISSEEITEFHLD